jgi:LacI family transcriptional regulator
MKKDVTMKDVAEHANVSVSTVSRVINGKISADTPIAKAVLKATEKLNYRPNAAARFMKGQRTGTIGVILPDIANPFFTGIAAGAISLKTSGIT